MLFNSFDFLVFFVIVYALYLNLRHRAQNVLLLVSSYVFYGWWDWRFTGLMLLSTVVNYACALRVEESASARARKRWLAAAIVIELAVLAFFKYFDFFVATAEAALSAAGLPVRMLHLGLVLPVGLSFYTFKTMAYTIDVYRGENKAARNFLDFALFVSFFPQLVAGPIERARSLLPQIARPRRALEAVDLEVALYLIGWGLFKKVIVADGCARIVNAVFADHRPFSGLDCLIAVYAFAFQIYGDFSGYSDMAIGLARLLGFELIANFRLPYFAANPADLWRRWHISLSTWLRDYLYIPLGGSRRGDLITYRNLILTMALGGLWHGARWTMVVWGLYHGVALAAHRFWVTRRAGRTQPAGLVPPVSASDEPRRDWRLLVKIALMFHATCLGWLLFRAQSMSQAAEILGRIVTDFRVTPWTLTAALTLAQLTWLLIGYEVVQFLRRDLFVALGWPARRRFAFGLALVYSTGLYWMLHRSVVLGGQPFIYFQF